MLKLWADDRPAAEAVLLHEVAHYRQGEHLIIGLGSPFSWLLRIWGPIFVLFTIVPLSYAVLARDPLAPEFGAQAMIDAALPARFLVLPVAAIWLAELSADAWARKVAGRRALRAALRNPAPESWWRLLDHPPRILRRLLAGRRAVVVVPRSCC